MINKILDFVIFIFLIFFMMFFWVNRYVDNKNREVFAKVTGVSINERKLRQKIFNDPDLVQKMAQDIQSCQPDVILVVDGIEMKFERTY